MDISDVPLKQKLAENGVKLPVSIKQDQMRVCLLQMAQ